MQRIDTGDLITGHGEDPLIVAAVSAVHLDVGQYRGTQSADLGPRCVAWAIGDIDVRRLGLVLLTFRTDVYAPSATSHRPNQPPRTNSSDGIDPTGPGPVGPAPGATPSTAPRSPGRTGTREKASSAEPAVPELPTLITRFSGGDRIGRHRQAPATAAAERMVATRLMSVALSWLTTSRPEVTLRAQIALASPSFGCRSCIAPPRR